MKPTVVFILSTPFAGSHFLSLMLGSHTQTKHVGELNALHKEHNRPGGPECRLKRGELLENIGEDEIHRIHEIIFSRVGPETKVLIDASKRVSWAKRFLENNSFERKYIHLIRDPRALVRRYATKSYYPRRFGHRWKLFKRFALRRPTVLFASHPTLRRHYWLMQNEAITSLIAKHHLNHLVITYRDLATNPAREVARAMNWLGLEFEPAQLEYWNFEHIGTEKLAYDWVKEKKETFIDLRWKTELSAEVQEEIQRDPLILKYLRALDLRFVDDGLSLAADRASVEKT